MKLIGLAFLSLLLITSCEVNETEVEDNNRDTVIVKEKETIREQAPAKEEEKVKEVEEPAKEPATKPWAAKMAQYHDLRCKMQTGAATVSDRTDQVVLLKDLNDIRDNLSKNERFYFNADMVKAEDMATCPK